ncbi:MAG: cytochrome c [Oligoflexales bacterium]
MDQIFMLEQQSNRPNAVANIKKDLIKIKESFEQISTTLDAQTRKQLDKSLFKLRSKFKSTKDLEEAIYQVKQETIEAFMIDTAPPLSPNFKLASAQYKEYCSACHGSTGNGHGILSERLPTKPEDFTSQLFSHKNSPLRTLNKLLVGSKKAGMPIFEHQLTNQELWSMSFYIQSLAHKTGKVHDEIEPILIKNGLNYSMLARLNDDELWSWIVKNLNEFDTSTKEAKKNIIASIRNSYSFSKKVHRR